MSVPMDVGQVVVSTAGHDKGRTYVVIGCSGGDYVLVTDGRIRPVANPKKKKIRHLRAGAGCISWIRERALSQVCIYDHEIRKHLESYIKVPHKEG